MPELYPSSSSSLRHQKRINGQVKEKSPAMSNTGEEDLPGKASRVKRKTGAGGTSEDAENIGDFERLQDETHLGSWEGDEDVHVGACGGVQDIQGRAAALQQGFTLFATL